MISPEAPDKTPTAGRGCRIGHLELAHFLLAPVRYGKTVRLAQMLRSVCGWALVLVHDAQFQFRRLTESGLPPGCGPMPECRFYPSVAAARAGIKKLGGASHAPPVLHVVERDDGDDVIRLALEYSRGARWQIKEKNHAGEVVSVDCGVPVIVAIDEVTNWDSGSTITGAFDKELGKLVVQRRHENIGFIFGGQSVKTAHKQLRALVTSIHAGAFTDKDQLDCLEGVHEFDRQRIQFLDAKRREWLICPINRCPDDLDQIMSETGCRAEVPLAIIKIFPALALKPASVIALIREHGARVHDDSGEPARAWRKYLSGLAKAQGELF